MRIARATGKEPHHNNDALLLHWLRFDFGFYFQLAF